MSVDKIIEEWLHKFSSGTPVFTRQNVEQMLIQAQKERAREIFAELESVVGGYDSNCSCAYCTAYKKLREKYLPKVD